MINVLIIDDSPEILDLLTLFLDENEEINCVTKTSGNTAVEYLKSNANDISLILSDFRMPDGNGDVVYEFNKKTNKLPFIFHTSTGPQDLKFYTPAEDYPSTILDKPCSPDQIIETIFNLTGLDHHAPKYFEISPFYCLKYFSILNSINISLSKEHFVEVSNGENPNKDYVESLVSDKGVSSFFIDAKSYRSLFDQITKSHDTNVISPKELITSITSLAAGLMEDPKEANFASNQVVSVTNSLFENNETAKLINSLFEDSEFMISHSLLTSFLCYRFLKASGRFTEKDMECFTKAAFFHDTALSTKEEESERNCLINKFYSHEQEVIKKLEKIKEIPQKTLDLIEKHHYLEKGKFSRLNQDEKLFNACHYISLIACMNKKFNFKEIKSNLELTDIGNEVLDFLFQKSS